MTTAQEARQATVRLATGTAYTYEGDWHALFDLGGIGGVTFNERMLLWINVQLGTSYDNINSAMAAYAADQGAYNWSGLGTFVIDSVGGGGAATYHIYGF